MKLPSRVGEIVLVHFMEKVKVISVGLKIGSSFAALRLHSLPRPQVFGNKIIGQRIV